VDTRAELTDGQWGGDRAVDAAGPWPVSAVLGEPGVCRSHTVCQARTAQEDPARRSRCGTDVMTGGQTATTSTRLPAPTKSFALRV